MKKTIRTLSLRAVPVLLTLALMLGIFCIAPLSARAVGVDITDRFVDENFRAAVRDELNLPADAPIYDTDVESIEILDVHGRNIENLAGIEYCIGLEELHCNNNAIVSLDVSGLSNLRILNCYENRLTELNVTGLTELRTLNCSSNQLSTLVTTDLAALRNLDCSYNTIIALNVSDLENLRVLDCSLNHMMTFEISNLPNLRTLICGMNWISELDVTEFTNLIEIDCSRNELTELNVTGLSNLNTLVCRRNRLAKLDLSGLAKLRLLECGDNQLTELDLSNLPSLEDLLCGSNQLTELDLTNLSSLSQLNCYNNQLTALDVVGLDNLQNIDCSYNELITLNIAKTDNLQYIDCSYNELTTLNVAKTDNLQYINCSYNELTTLNIVEADNLQYLFCNNNQLPTLDATGLPGLQILDCGYNKLITLNTSGLTHLTELQCYSNHLTALDITDSVNLWWLSCQYNYMNSEADVIGDISNISYFDFSPQHAPGFYGVTNISGVPKRAVAYTPFPLTTTVFPSNATNSTIEWSVDDYDITGSTVVNNTLYTTGLGRVYLIATIKNGTAEGVDFEQYFYIDVTIPDNVLPFFDVPENIWYHEYVKTAYDDGLIHGKAPGFYYPEDNMTVAEAVKIAACMHQLYNDGAVTLTNAEPPAPWYASYMDYALQNNIIDADLSGVTDTKITRKEFVYILHSALPESEYGAINNVADDAIPDVKISSDSKYAPRIYEFYRAGILTGSDEIGTFNPESNIKRNEVAAVLTRMLHESARRQITLG